MREAPSKIRRHYIVKIDAMAFEIVRVVFKAAPPPPGTSVASNILDRIGLKVFITVNNHEPFELRVI